MKKLTQEYAKKLLTERLGRRFYNDTGRLVTAKEESEHLSGYLLERFDDIMDDYLIGYASEIDYLGYICPKCGTVWNEMLEDCGHYTATMIRYYRLKNGLSLRKLAKKLGYKSHSIIADWENGRRTPKVISLKKLADAFGIRYWQLFFIR